MKSHGSFVRWSIACLATAGLVVVGTTNWSNQVASEQEAQLRTEALQLANRALSHAEQTLDASFTVLDAARTDTDLLDAAHAFERSGDYRAQLRMQDLLRQLTATLQDEGTADVLDQTGLVIASSANARIGSQVPAFEWKTRLADETGGVLGITDSRIHIQTPLLRNQTAIGTLHHAFESARFHASLETALQAFGPPDAVRVRLLLDAASGQHRLTRIRRGTSMTWLDGFVPAEAVSERFPLSVAVQLPKLSAVQAGADVRSTGQLVSIALVATAVLFMILHALMPYFQGMQLLRHVRPRSSDEPVVVPDTPATGERHTTSERMAYDILATHHVLEEVLKEHTAELEKLYRVLNQEHRKRDAAEAALKAAEERFHEAVEGCMEGVWEWSAVEGLRTWISETFLVALGLRRSEFGGSFQDFLAAMHEDDRNPCFAAFQQQVRYGSHFEVEYRLRNRKGEWHWFLSRGQLIRKDGQVQRVMGSIQDIQSRKRAELEVEHLVRELEDRAHRDGLTGLHNRASFLEIAQKEIKRTDRSTQPLSLMMLDLDHFKRVNDEYGHAVGDQVLRELAEALGEELRDSDTCARFGGEEFVVLLPETSNLHACRLAERLRSHVAERKAGLDGGRNVPFTCSIGVTRLQPGETLEALMSRADQLMYQAKRAGRNQICSDCEGWQALSRSVV